MLFSQWLFLCAFNKNHFFRYEYQHRLKRTELMSQSHETNAISRDKSAQIFLTVTKNPFLKRPNSNTKPAYHNSEYLLRQSLIAACDALFCYTQILHRSIFMHSMFVMCPLNSISNKLQNLRLLLLRAVLSILANCEQHSFRSVCLIGLLK